MSFDRVWLNARLATMADDALGLKDRGMLAEGMHCDLALYAIERPAELCYWLGGNPCIGRVVAGEAA